MGAKLYLQKDADNLCAGEIAPNSWWFRRCFRLRSHFALLAPEIQKQTKDITGGLQGRFVVFRDHWY